MNRRTLSIAGMKCSSCSARVERALVSLAGVEEATIHLTMGMATITGEASLESVAKEVTRIGFTVPETTEHYRLRGLSCASCVARCEAALGALDGVREVHVNLATQEATVRSLAGAVSFESLRRAVEEKGFELIRLEAEQDLGEIAERERLAEHRDIQKRLAVGLLLGLGVFFLGHGWSLGPDRIFFLEPFQRHFWQWILVTPIQFWVGGYFHHNALKAARSGSVNMHSLVTLGTFTSYLYSVVVLWFPSWLTVEGMVPQPYFDTSGSIIILILVGRLLEARAKGQTSRAIRQLIELAPKTAWLVREGEEVEIPLGEVKPGDRLLVKPGEKVPLDGVILRGHSTLDESMMTGESAPVDRAAGEEVVGGTLNRTGVLTIQVTKVGNETVLAQIVAMVRQAQGSKPPIARLADRISGVFVPVVMGLAGLTFLVWWGWGPEPALTYALLNAVSVLIIACPCALGLATPMSIMVGTGVGAQQGILIRGGEVLETACRVDTVVFDKTGTLTRGEPALTDWQGTEEDLARVAAVERGSEHPIAQAVVAGQKARGGMRWEADHFESVSGMGVKAEVDGQIIVVGTRLWMERQGVDCAAHLAMAEAYENEGKSAVFAAKGGAMIGVAAVADTVREESREAVARLKAMGLEVIMLTGDNLRTARHVAGQLAIDQFFSTLLPGQKEQKIEEMRQNGRVVAMVGDGINDAPALAKADVGFAMASGTDVAMETAGVTLMSGDPRGVARAIHLSRLTMGNIRQNLFWAFIYNVVLIPLAAGVWYPWFGLLLSPVLAASAMGLSSVTVVSNALRLRRCSLK